MLGEGGMGAVYKAKDLDVDRDVALKVIRPEYASRPEILARFKQELILARQITHKNVIRIFDLGQAEGIRFITMEYVDGQDLYSLLRSGEQLSVERKVKIAREICKALEAAHEQGVVHRDLKPQNIMVDKNGRVLVMDFGIARSMEDTGLTSTGALVGTPAFMSPEQAKGEKLDTRSDLFSFGVIFYEMLTGKAPYVAETAVGLLPNSGRNHSRPGGLAWRSCDLQDRSRDSHVASFGNDARQPPDWIVGRRESDRHSRHDDYGAIQRLEVDFARRGCGCRAWRRGMGRGPAVPVEACGTGRSDDGDHFGF
jgi:serine/threonine protein kinase